jgi:hypothetical protein
MELLRGEREKHDKLLVEYGQIKARLGVQVNNENMDDGAPAMAKSPAAVNSSPLFAQAAIKGEEATQRENSRKSATNWFPRIF